MQNGKPLTMTLNDGRSMPQLGYGLWQIPDGEAATAVTEAFRVGYRLIDSAMIYRNETGLGQAIKRSGLPREELFITTKVWNEDQGYDRTLRAFDTSLQKLGLPSVDLYLIHWPSPKRGLYVETWKALLKLRQDGRAKSVGVSNFPIEALERLHQETGEWPSVNQVELHPLFQQRALRDFHAKHGIVTESWSPLGRGQLFTDPVVSAVARKHGKSAAQVILRWHLQRDLVVIPKSVTPARISENFDILDFALDALDLRQLDGLDSPTGRVGPDPATADF